MPALSTRLLCALDAHMEPEQDPDVARAYKSGLLIGEAIDDLNRAIRLYAGHLTEKQGNMLRSDIIDLRYILRDSKKKSLPDM